jgi:tRNA pseudouridine38-40 synthase
MPLRNIKLTICYDGRNYHGWQIQPDRPTIQDAIQTALKRLTGSDIKITGASRTDAGVHALGQVANFRIDSPIPPANYAKALTQMLPEDIAVSKSEQADEKFDAISSAKNKLYRYKIYTAKVRPVMDIRYCWNWHGQLDHKKMAQAGKYFIGTHDFKSFASAADQREDSVRTIYNCDVSSDSDWITIEVKGNRFLYNMVRNMVGTLLQIGTQRWQPTDIKEILKAKDRTAAGPLAPPNGLCLMKVNYE